MSRSRGWRCMLISFVLCLVACTTNTPLSEQTGQETLRADASAEVVAEKKPRQEPSISENRPEPPPRERVQESTLESVPEPRQEPPPPDAGPDSQPDTAPSDRANPPTGAMYEKAGPLQAKQLPVETLTLPPSSGCTGSKCKVSAVWTVPQGVAGLRKAPFPLVVFSNGFQMKKEQYKSYAEHFASWGYVVLRYDIQGESLLSPARHDVLGKAITALLGLATSKNRQAGVLKGLLDTSRVVLVGHSRGGKVSALAAQNNATVKAYIGIDPVDSNPPFGGGAISAAKGMSKVKAPVLLLGAELGGRGFQPCAPTAENYAKFYKETTSTALEVLMKDVGHAQFIDNRRGCLSCSLCTAGRVPDTTVLLWSRTLAVAWMEQHLRGLDTSRYLKGVWLQNLVNGNKISIRSKP